jgi:DNA-binding IclR family transcriptional regulator
MSNAEELQKTILQAPSGLTLAELLAHHPNLARRTAQRLLSQMADEGVITTHGEARARRYMVLGPRTLSEQTDSFPGPYRFLSIVLTSSITSTSL